jgi:sugar lactone lactonase YvrE
MVATVVMAAACEPATPPAAPPPPPPPPPVASAPETPAAAKPAALTEAPKSSIPAAIVVKDAAIKTPESVLYDAEADVYLVSNINGKPTEADDNGTIIKVDPEGKVIDAAFIDGAKKDIKLNAPKGMAIVGDALYVTDLDVVRIFDKKTGKAKGEIRAPKATFLNDISVGPANKLYVSDSGLKLGKDGLETNGSDAVFVVDTKAVNAKVLSAKKELHGPNGVLADDDGVYVVTYGGAELYRLNKKGEKEHVTTLPKGGLDGIVKLADGTLLVSSWEGQAIYRGRPGGTFEPVLSNLAGAADIGFDSKRNRVLIPGFTTDTVTIQPLPELKPIAEPQLPASDKAATPATPAKPADKAATPATPAKPADKAATPATPAKPAEKAVTPAKPTDKAATPATPAAPAKPAEKAATPAAPATPAKPAEKATDKPATPAKPAEKPTGAAKSADKPAAVPATPAAPAAPKK